MADEDEDLGFPVPSDVEIVERATPFQGYFRIDRYRLRHRKHDGTWTDVMTREVFERGHVVAVLLYDPARDAVVLLNQFRIGALAARKPAWQNEVVAGVIEPGESPEEVARREAEEEAGCRVDELIFLYDALSSPGGATETVKFYLGLVDSRGAGGIHGLDEEHEDIKVAAVPFDEAWAMLEAGRIDNAPGLITLQWLALNRGRLRARYGG